MSGKQPSLLLITICLIVAGCSTPSANRSPGEISNVELTSFWQPHLLFLLDSPHRRLYVEVDAVEGCAPSDAKLESLRKFLAAHCRKPDGIEIARSDLIPIKDAKGITPENLARKFLDGAPQNTGGSSPTLIQILFYDGALCDQLSDTDGGATGKKTPRRKEKNMPSHVNPLPYPAVILINTRYGPSVAKYLGPDEDLLHEAGHVLGLVRRPTDSSDYHCVDPACCMKADFKISLHRQLLGLDSLKHRPFCKKCSADLANSLKQPALTNLRFVGPVMVRSEPGYYVLTLPDHIALIVGSLNDQDCRDFATEVRAYTPAPGDANKWRSTGWIKDEAHADPAKLREVISRAKTDPLRDVRMLASRIEQQESKQ